jgi:hypothetical protein
LRCKTCKAGVHLWCSEEISHQQCPGKTVSGGLSGGMSEWIPQAGSSCGVVPGLGKDQSLHGHDLPLSFFCVLLPQSTSFRRNFSSPLLVHESSPACAMSRESPPTGECPPPPRAHSSVEKLYSSAGQLCHSGNAYLVLLVLLFSGCLCSECRSHSFMHPTTLPSTSTFFSTYEVPGTVLDTGT